MNKRKVNNFKVEKLPNPRQTIKAPCEEQEMDKESISGLADLSREHGPTLKMTEEQNCNLPDFTPAKMITAMAFDASSPGKDDSIQNDVGYNSPLPKAHHPVVMEQAE